MSLKPQTSDLNTQTCDLCGSPKHQFVLTTERLDGPLVRCLDCGLFYVLLDQGLNKATAMEGGKTAEDAEERSGTHRGEELLGETRNSITKPLRASAPSAAETLPESQHAANEMARLSQRARELELVEASVEESETPWRELMARQRVDELKRFVTGGCLLEVGSSTGEFLRAASGSFAATGIEADRASATVARSRGLDCINSTLADAGLSDEHFAVAATYHVIEHFRSPRAELRELHRVLQPGGWLVIETPNIDTLWFRLLGARWRQFIPDHIFFFTPDTLTRLCAESGFEVRALHNVGKAMSVRLFISRVGRYNKMLARGLNVIATVCRLHDHTLNLKLGDVMRLYTQKPRANSCLEDATRQRP